ncbi:MAG: ABC transporter ATP-binding protein [Thermodesulfobacteriota bacterium]|nr:MAG: ABC transporter ATP-binding protein [Thermodesulfobacteriota bacterium]
MINLIDISKNYGDNQAVRSIDLRIQSAKTTVLIGPSGCGKSTILRTIIGLISPDSGEVNIEGDTLRPNNLISLRRKMGYVIQEGGLFPNLSAKENVSLMASFLSWDKISIQKRIDELCDLTKFPKDALQRYPIQISGGQRQRLSLMRALMLNPNILLLDEPLGALDPLIRSELQQDLKDIFSTLGKTVVMVTHDMGEAAFFADKIVLIKDGQIMQEGNIYDLIKTPSNPFVTTFINAQRNHLEKIGDI